MKMLVLLLPLLTVSECDITITGRTGQSITLPCRYDIKVFGPTPVCWGRGHIPLRGCINQLLATDGCKVKDETRLSSRYQLKGSLDKGDVSLTIVNATEEDSGLYGCRVEIPGPFNDEKHHINLTVRRGLITTPSSDTTSSSSDGPQTTATIPTSGHMTSTDRVPTSSSAVNDSDKDVTLLVLALVVFILLVLVTTGVFIIMNTRWIKRKVLSPPPQIQMQQPTQVEENIYYIDAKDNGDYEMCP